MLLINEGGLGNIGDEAIRCCLEHLLRSQGCDVEWAAFSRAGLPSASPTRSRTMPSRWWRRIIKAMVPVKVVWLMRHGTGFWPYVRSVSPDLVIVGGGQLIQSNGVFALAMFLWVLLLKRIRRCRVVLLGVGVAERFTPIDRALFRWSLHQVDGVYVRDRASVEIVRQSFGIVADSCPDAAFCSPDVISDERAPLKRALLCPADYAFYVGKRGRRGHPFSEAEYRKYWIDAAKRYAAEGYEVRYFCTSSRQDLPYVKRLRSCLKEQHGLEVDVDAAATFPAVCKLIQSAEVVVAARMHALILAFAYVREVVAFHTSEKIDAFVEEYFQCPDAGANARQRVHEVIEKLVAES